MRYLRAIQPEKHPFLINLPKIASAAFIAATLFLISGCGKGSNADTAEIIKIVDGDTYHIIYNGSEEKVRLIGVDTPESKRNKKAKKDARKDNADLDDVVKMGRKAAEFAKRLVKPHDKVRIEFDARQRDQYGRLLAYLYLADGRMLNEVLVKEGYASPLTYPPNVKYVQRFLDAYKYARENNRGLWGE